MTATSKTSVPEIKNTLPVSPIGEKNVEYSSLDMGREKPLRKAMKEPAMISKKPASSKRSPRDRPGFFGNVMGISMKERYTRPMAPIPNISEKPNTVSTIGSSGINGRSAPETKPTTRQTEATLEPNSVNRLVTVKVYSPVKAAPLEAESPIASMSLPSCHVTTNIVKRIARVPIPRER